MLLLIYVSSKPFFCISIKGHLDISKKYISIKTLEKAKDMYYALASLPSFIWLGRETNLKSGVHCYILLTLGTSNIFFSRKSLINTSISRKPFVDNNLIFGFINIWTLNIQICTNVFFSIFSNYCFKIYNSKPFMSLLLQRSILFRRLSANNMSSRQFLTWTNEQSNEKHVFLTMRCIKYQEINFLQWCLLQ